MGQRRRHNTPLRERLHHRGTFNRQPPEKDNKRSQRKQQSKQMTPESKVIVFPFDCFTWLHYVTFKLSLRLSYYFDSPGFTSILQFASSPFIFCLLLLIIIPFRLLFLLLRLALLHFNPTYRFISFLSFLPPSSHSLSLLFLLFLPFIHYLPVTTTIKNDSLVSLLFSLVYVFS